MKKLATGLFVLIMVFQITDASAQERTVTGQVTVAEDGSPLPGVTIKVKDTNRGTTTDAEGNYEITVSGDATLVFSFIGFQSTEVSVGGQTEINVSLSQSTARLDELVVTALGIERERKELGYSVQTVDAENISSAPDPNIINSLSGKIAGVNVTSGGSTIGASSRITIRGNASFGGNQPLFVVDGIPIDNSTTDLAGGGGVDYGNAASDIDPENIESITVLKGASASALYGSRATDGAILVTTKEGKTGGGFTVDFSSSVVAERVAYIAAYQNEYGGGAAGSEYKYNQFLENNPGSNLTYNEYARQYSYNYKDGMGGGVNDGGPNINWGPRMDAGLLIDQWDSGPDSPFTSHPDNVQNFFDNGTTMNNHLAIAGQSEIANGRLAVKNSGSKGVIPNTDQGQTTLNGSFTLNPNDRLTASTNFTYLKKQSDNIPRNGYGGQVLDFTWSGRNFNTEAVRDVFEENFNDGYEFPNSNNPIADYHLNTNSLERDRLYGNISLGYDILDWLTVKARGGMDYYDETRESIQRPENKFFQQSGIGGRFNRGEISRQEINADLMAEFNKQLSPAFSVDGIVGANIRQDEYSSLSVGASDLTVPGLYTISNAEGTPDVGQYESNKETQSVYASANISFREYLFLGMTARNDWSSTLPENNRSYFYPSVNLGLSITDAFDIGSDVFTYGRLRASWARVGSDTGPYQLNRTYFAGSFNNISTFAPAGTLPPTNLKPEQTESYEIGAELRFFSDRLGLDITYYNQVTNDQILNVPTPQSAGYASRLLNAAEVENRGVELIINGNILQSEDLKGLNWDAQINWAKNSNKVNSLYEGLESIQISPGFGGARSLGVPGEEWGAIYGLPFVRDDNNNIVVGSDGLPLTTNEAVKLGSVTPDWTGGIRNSLRFMRFNMSFLLDFKMGGDVFSTTAWHSYPTGSYKVTTANNVREEGLVFDGFRFADGAVKEDGSPNDIRVAAQDFFNGSWVWNNHEYSILDASYIKFRELTLGYSFNTSNIGWLSGLRELSVSAYGRNLAILYRSDSMKDYMLDPEVQLGGGTRGVGFENFQVPTTRTFGFKVNIGI